MSHLAFIYFKRFICLAALGLSWGTLELPPSLLRAGFFFFSCRMYGIWFPDQGSNPGPLHWSLSHWTTREAPHYLVFVKF